MLHKTARDDPGAPCECVRQQRQRGVVSGERVDEAGRAVVVVDAGGEDAAGASGVEPPAAEGWEVGQVRALAALGRREGPVEVHAGGEEAARRDEPRVEGGGRRRRRAPWLAHGVEAQEVGGVVQVARDLAEHIGGELGPRRRIHAGPWYTWWLCRRVVSAVGHGSCKFVYNTLIWKKQGPVGFSRSNNFISR